MFIGHENENIYVKIGFEKSTCAEAVNSVRLETTAMENEDFHMRGAVLLYATSSAYAAVAKTIWPAEELNRLEVQDILLDIVREAIQTAVVQELPYDQAV